MACGCNDSLFRVFQYPVSKLDKLENQLLKDVGGFVMTPLENYQKFKFLKGFTHFDTPSQIVLASRALKDKATNEETVTACVLNGIYYPLLVNLLAEMDTDELELDAIANQLTEDRLVSFIQDSTDDW